MLLLVFILVVKGNEAYNMFEGDLVIQFLSNIYLLSNNDDLKIMNVCLLVKCFSYLLKSNALVILFIVNFIFYKPFFNYI